MVSVNRVIIGGNLTRDPELRYTPDGTAVTTFTVAISRRWKTKDGEAREETCFVDVVAMGRQAEICGEYLNKGRAVIVDGRLTQRTWETESGERRSKIEVRANRVHFLGPPPQAVPLPLEEVVEREEVEEEFVDDLPF
jgi:single-strand DNA-binding protein